MSPAGLQVAPEVEEAVRAGRPVVALESTLLAHGLPQPRGRRVADRVEQTVREAGAVPATVGVLGGRPVVGLDADGLDRLADPGVAKLSARDLPVAVAKGVDGATTVAATATLACAAGLRVFATGGLGGVHREARQTWDESADLHVLARLPMVVVCAGVKSILDVGATLERLETLGVTVLGYGTDAFPGFYLCDSGHPTPWRVDAPHEVAAVARAAAALGGGAVVVGQPVAADEQVDPATHDLALTEATREAARRGIAGAAVTPFLLGSLHRITDGQTLEVNVTVILANARLAAAVAVALAA